MSDDTSDNTLQIEDTNSEKVFYLANKISHATRKKIYICSGILVIIGLLLLVILLPLSYHSVEYNEYAYKRSSISQKIDWTTAYTNGNHFWGVGYVTFPFNRTMQRVVLKNLSVVPTSGLEFFLDIVFYYRLNRTAIPDLFTDFGMKYNDQIVKIAIGAIKDLAPKYDFEQYFNNRKLIEDDLENTVRQSLSKNHVIIEQGMFFMHDMVFPKRIIDKYLQTGIQLQESATANFVQQQAIIEQETNYMISLFINNATFINSTTSTQINKMLANANSVGFNLKESAKGRGLKYFLENINVTKPENIDIIIRTMTYLAKQPQFLIGNANYYINK